jgi:MFS family permease
LLRAEEPPSPTVQAPRAILVSALGTAQTLAWASSYYVPAILADPIAAEIRLPRSWVFAAFSTALLIAAFVGPAVGRFIDRRGGRGVLMASNLVLAAGLLGLASVTGPLSLFAAWTLLGIGMALGLYDSAFATLAVIYGSEARGPIIGVTLFAGFASTVSWPLSAALEQTLTWRGACVTWAAINLAIALPLNYFLLPSVKPSTREHQPSGAVVGWQPYKEMLLLAFVFAAAWFVTGAMAAHLPRLLERAGASAHQAIAAAALVGPAQVAARLAEFVLLRRVHPLVPARLAAALHPIGTSILALLGPVAAPLFVLLYGAGNGLLTIARGTVPLALFGPSGYGERTGLLGAPARAAQALAPFIFGFLLDNVGVTAAISVSATLCLAALGALLYLRAGPPNAPGKIAASGGDVAERPGAQ